MGVNKCVACGNDKSSDYLKEGKYKYLECKKCNLLFLSNKPTKASLRKTYSTYTSGSDKSDSEINSLNPALKYFLRFGVVRSLLELQSKFTFKNRYSYLSSVNPKKGRILDVGSGAGQFLNLAKKDGWDVYGIEMDMMHTKRTKELFGSKRVHLGEFGSERFGKKFEVITMWHVFEHLPNPKQALKRVNKLLSNHGSLIIEVPTSDSLMLKLFKNNWTLLLPPLHLQFWSEKSLREILSKNGFELKQVNYPMYYPFTLASSIIKAYPSTKYLSPILFPLSTLVNLVVSKFSKGDIIRIYAIKA